MVGLGVVTRKGVFILEGLNDLVGLGLSSGAGRGAGSHFIIRWANVSTGSWSGYVVRSRFMLVDPPPEVKPL